MRHACAREHFKYSIVCDVVIKMWRKRKSWRVRLNESRRVEIRTHAHTETYTHSHEHIHAPFTSYLIYDCMCTQNHTNTNSAYKKSLSLAQKKFEFTPDLMKVTRALYIWIPAIYLMCDVAQHKPVVQPKRKWVWHVLCLWCDYIWVDSSVMWCTFTDCFLCFIC